MYRAKQQGRDTYHVFDTGLDREIQSREASRQRFAIALAEGELTLHYQPQVDMFGGMVIGAEALVRWQHPEEGLLSPGSFLPIIEGTALEIELGEWVIEAALGQPQAWTARGIEMPVHVNISPAHLLSGEFAARLDWLLKRYPEVPARLLKLEELESAAMHDIQSALAAMRACQSLGIDLAIVESVIYMANRFRRPMLAEGVETLDHARALLALGCGRVQGYGIARPMPAEGFPDWLREWPARQEWSTLASHMQGLSAHIRPLETK